MVTLVTELAAPALLTVTLPGLGTGAVVTAQVADTLRAVLALPAVLASEKTMTETLSTYWSLSTNFSVP